MVARRARSPSGHLTDSHLADGARLRPRPMVGSAGMEFRRGGTVSWIVGCDTGGTFTDVFAVSETGESRVAKVPSTPPRFDLGVVEGVRALGIEPSEVTTLFHGTTVTTNAVITRAGAHSALVTTRGFRDVLEIRRANRAELYDILWDPPEPLDPPPPPAGDRRARRLLGRRRDAARRGLRARRRPQAAGARDRVGRDLPDQRPHEPRARAARAGDPAGGAARAARLALDRHPARAARVRAHRDDRRQRLLRAGAAQLHGHARGGGSPRPASRPTSCSSCTTAAAR